jgi:hypothetical protein
MVVAFSPDAPGAAKPLAAPRHVRQSLTLSALGM